jgi:hypothetical protein
MYGEHIYEETENGLKITITMTVTGLLSRLDQTSSTGYCRKFRKDIANQIKNKNYDTILDGFCV